MKKWKLMTPLDGVTFILGLTNLSFAAFDIGADTIDWTTLVSVLVGIFAIVTAGWQPGDDT